jgi:SagB-type dehydrogenase family enzyme
VSEAWRLRETLAATTTFLQVKRSSIMETFVSPTDQQRVTSLTVVLRTRRSCREFTSEPLTAREIAELCWAAQGITDHAAGLRTVPSAGALYPLSLYVVDQAGIHEYCARAQELNQWRSGDFRDALQAAAFNQLCVGDAPACFATAIDVGMVAWKYGNRAERYCLLEAGHAAQNILLMATSLGLAAVPVGAFSDDLVAKVLNLPDHLRPVYLIPVGHALAGA